MSKVLKLGSAAAALAIAALFVTGPAHALDTANPQVAQYYPPPYYGPPPYPPPHYGPAPYPPAYYPPAGYRYDPRYDPRYAPPPPPSYGGQRSQASANPRTMRRSDIEAMEREETRQLNLEQLDDEDDWDDDDS